ncbi:GntR family transcriptional regulator [Ruegeria sp. HKCCD8929]|uniref:GntR family transcriptional regulator n=1 Tax=Ruegeria sp. HKCCD8929 TaxID=2683006 RepID=UPI0014893E77|nr:GntR family transcriptional regulator [Ruegeria sp. HKCCD8929]
MTTPPLTKIEQPPATLRDLVQDRMREAIIEGHFKPGERLVERPLCEQLGVSRTVIRETIRYLEAEGLVEILPGHGPIVARMNWDDARQIYDVRRMLETSAAMTCAERMTPDLAKRLQKALGELMRGFTRKNPGALFKATAGFYGTMFEGAGHAVAWEIVQRLNGRISRLRMMTLSSPDRDQPGPDHMKAICKAITSGDPEAARTAVNRHLDDATTVAERLLAEETQTE